MRNSNLRNFNGVEYDDPYDALRARIDKAEEHGDKYTAVPNDLLRFCLQPRRECSSTTVVNGDRMAKMLVQVKCQLLVDPITGRHEGLHVNGRDTWE